MDRLFQPDNVIFGGIGWIVRNVRFMPRGSFKTYKKKEIHDHYLGKIIQNEVVNLIGDAALKKL